MDQERDDYADLDLPPARRIPEELEPAVIGCSIIALLTFAAGLVALVCVAIASLA